MPLCVEVNHVTKKIRDKWSARDLCVACCQCLKPYGIDMRKISDTRETNQSSKKSRSIQSQFRLNLLRIK